jgi:hypothetical protein
MSPWCYLKDYIQELPEDDGVISLLFEATFDSMGTESLHFVSLCSTKRSESSRPLKRKRATSQNAAEPASQIARPRGLRVISSTKSTDPIDVIAPPPYTPPYNDDTPGQVSVDKTRFLPALDELLEKHPCIVALPPGTGKTTLEWMITSRYDHRLNFIETFERLFRYPPTAPQ